MLTELEFKLFRRLIYDESGIYLKDTRRDFLENRLAMRMKKNGIRSPYWYYKMLLEKSTKELSVLLDILTINETCFFRNRPQMEYFKNIILPEVVGMKRRRSDKQLRVWSAGCSTGEEPYSITMDIMEVMPFVDTWDIKVFASDLSLTALETASTGEYPFDRVVEQVEENYIFKYFIRAGDMLRVKDIVKEYVAFDFHNLKNDNGLRNLDIIFCRNVMIYFDEAEQRKLIEKFYESLNSGGYLFLGHSESLYGLNAEFEITFGNKATAYRKPLMNEHQEIISVNEL